VEIRIREGHGRWDDSAFNFYFKGKKYFKNHLPKLRIDFTFALLVARSPKLNSVPIDFKEPFFVLPKVVHMYRLKCNCTFVFNIVVFRF
jgi:hypothetical protein